MRKSNLLILFFFVLKLCNCLTDDCRSKCSLAKNSKVCGRNGHTYDNECYLHCANVEKLQDGHCIGKCIRERLEAKLINEKLDSNKQLSNNDHDHVLPECNEQTGNYLSVQCHLQTGYCWCVNIYTGKPISGSTVKGNQTYCQQYQKEVYHKPLVTTTQQETYANSQDGKNEGQIDKKAKRKCYSDERKQFNTNLIDAFINEFKIRRSNQWQNLDQTQLILRSINFYFNQLDKNSDSKLDRNELKNFRRLIVKVIEPNHCGRTFIKICDLNIDHLLAIDEWQHCLNNSRVADDRKKHKHRKPNESSAEITDSSFSLDAINKSYRKQSYRAERRPIESSGIPFLQSSSSSKLNNEDADSDDNEQENLGRGIQLSEDCHKSKLTAIKYLEEMPQSKLFVPECDPVKRKNYQPVQCHKETGYCWCANIFNGHPLQGTSKYQETPTCDENTDVSRAATSTTSAPVLEVKGCQPRKRQRFIREILKNFLINWNKVSPNAEKQIALMPLVRWKFKILDKDENSLLDRKEWKVLRMSLFEKNDTMSNFRKCWRSFARYCDLDNNHLIDESEWIVCLNQNLHQQSPKPATSSNGASFGLNKRRGPNPFSTILKAD